MILNSLNTIDRSYVRLDYQGYIDHVLLQSHYSGSNNYQSLLKLVKSDQYIITISLSDYYYYLDANEVQSKRIMSYQGIDSFFIGNSNGKGINTSTGEVGFLGKTLFPDFKGKENSIDSNINVIININLTQLGRSETFAHEAYGHALLYVISNGDRDRASHDFGSGNTDNNKELYEMINSAIQETTANYYENN